MKIQYTAIRASACTARARLIRPTRYQKHIMLHVEKAWRAQLRLAEHYVLSFVLFGYSSTCFEIGIAGAQAAHANLAGSAFARERNVRKAQSKEHP